MTCPSVPMMVRHRSPESLASHGRRTTITWSCKTKKLKRTVPPGLVRREAGGRPQCRPRRRQRPNCRIGRGVGLLRCRRSCVFWQRLTPPPTRPCPLPPAAAAPELSDRPRRRTFTVQTKLRVLAEIDAAADVGGIGAILRREGLYSSILTDWRRLRDSGALGALTPAKRGPKRAVLNPLAAELARARRENARLGRRLEHAEAIIEVQKKVAALLGIPLATPDSDDES